MDALDRVQMLKNIFTQSRTVQEIIASAEAEASVYLIKYPEAVIFDGEDQIIDPLYEDIYERAEKRVREIVSSAKRRQALRRRALRA